MQTRFGDRRGSRFAHQLGVDLGAPLPALALAGVTAFATPPATLSFSEERIRRVSVGVSCRPPACEFLLARSSGPQRSLRMSDSGDELTCRRCPPKSQFDPKQPIETLDPSGRDAPVIRGLAYFPPHVLLESSA
jgi:hypothetical protein